VFDYSVDAESQSDAGDDERKSNADTEQPAPYVIFMHRATVTSLTRKTVTRRSKDSSFIPSAVQGSITFAKVIPPDPLPDEVGERLEFSWIAPKDRPWKMGDKLAVKFSEFSGRSSERALVG
jgi:hypothetical protein